MSTEQLPATNWNEHWLTIGRASLIERLRVFAVWNGYRRLVHGLQFPGNPHVLELGAGTGHASLHLVRKLGGRATLVESNIQAIEMSRELWRRKGLEGCVTYEQSDLLSFDGGTQFDLVHSGGVLEHFHGESRRRACLAHCRNVRLGGYLVVIVPFDDARYRTFRWVLKRLGKWIYDDEVPFISGEIDANFLEFGFHVARSAVIWPHEVGYLLERVR